MILHTARLRLREFVAADWQAIQAYQATAAYQRLHPEVRPTEADVRALVQRFIAWAHEQPRSKYQWAVELAGDSQLIGTVGIRKATPTADGAEIGCELAPAYWGQGYATELGRLLLHIGFTELRLQRIDACTRPENQGAIRLLEKLGLRCEPRVPQDETLIYSLTAPTLTHHNP